MKFLLDQDVYELTRRFLTGLGHDIRTARQEGLAQASDADVLAKAHSLGRILVTNDADYGHLVFRAGSAGAVIFLRTSPDTQDAVHAELSRLLQGSSESRLQASFVMVEPGRYRIRPLAAEGGQGA